MTFVPPEINNRAPGGLLIVGRDPGENEVAEGRPFVGKAGELLDQVLAETGFRRRDINIANVCGYRPPNNEFKAHDPLRVEQGIIALHALIRNLKPRLIITLGNEASYAVIDDWPTRGRGIFGAKGIEDRRGYFWDSKYGAILSTLHPAGVIRKLVPGRYLLGKDFKRARRWLKGELSRDSFPVVKRLTQQSQVEWLMRQKLLAWDIETKWDMTALLCSGYCGEDYQPYVAVAPYEFQVYGRQLVAAGPPLVGHNGPGFDVPAMAKFFKLAVPNYAHDTQQMWWALEPDLAGTSDTDEEDKAIGPARMTRKGLAFLASLYFNLPWWKNYPEPDDPLHLPKMVELNGRDAFVTRWLAECMLPEMRVQKVVEQYKVAVSLYPATVSMQLTGIPVNESLRRERMASLKTRHEAAKRESATPGLAYIEKSQAASFAKSKRCPCCGGGKVLRTACWRCAGLTKKPSKKSNVSLSACLRCNGVGKIVTYQFNPYSPVQMKKFLYEVIGAPQHIWKGKITTDATALKKILRWARGQ